MSAPAASNPPAFRVATFPPPTMTTSRPVRSSMRGYECATSPAILSPSRGGVHVPTGAAHEVSDKLRKIPLIPARLFLRFPFAFSHPLLTFYPMSDLKIGVMGGTGLGEILPPASVRQHHRQNTPFGSPR